MPRNAGASKGDFESVEMNEDGERATEANRSGFPWNSGSETRELEFDGLAKQTDLAER